MIVRDRCSSQRHGKCKRGDSLDSQKLGQTTFSYMKESEAIHASWMFSLLCVCWPRTPSLTQLSSLLIAHTLFILIEKEREREMSHSHIIHFSLKDTRIWSSLLVRPIDQSETTHNVLTKQCPHRCTHKTQYKGVGRRKQTLTQSVVFSLRILIDLSE